MPKIIPHRVKTIREALDKSLADISRKAGLSERNLQRIESHPTDKRNVNEHTFKKLVSALHVEAAVLTGELPMPEHVVNRGNHTSQNKPPKEEVFETRLVKLDDEFVIVEFSDAHPTGRVIARDIVDEAAGLRLSSASELRTKLRELYRMITHPYGFLEGFGEEYLGPNFEPDPEDQFEYYVAGLGRLLDARPPSHNFVMTDLATPVQVGEQEGNSRTENLTTDTLLPKETKP